MGERVVIPFSQLEKDLLAFFEERAEGLRVADVVSRFCEQHQQWQGPEIKAALWQLLAERYLTMTSDRLITRCRPEPDAGEPR